MNYTPIKVKIGLNAKGYADYPNFNALSNLDGMDWSQYVDSKGLGWHYDKTSGHKESSDDSPMGQQWGVLIVPKAFADEAVAMFPNECTKLTETELEDFYDNKAHAHEPEETVNEQALKIYSTIEGAGGTLTATQKTKRTNALNPDNAELGINKNLNKKWSDYKVKVGATID